MIDLPTKYRHLGAGCALALALTTLSSCGPQAGGVIEVYETSGYQPNFGPFDSNGNYVDKWADNPPRRKYIPRGKKKSSPPPRPKENAYVAAPAPAPTPVSSKPKATRPTATAVKPKTKPPVTHTVKRGDTLYGLSRKYGTTVSSIQKANNLRGTTIGIGQRLIIPRK